MTTATNELELSPVPATAQQDGNGHTRWAWAEPSVWTDRMLTALFAELGCLA